MMPPSVLPVAANWAAWETFSPSTSFGVIASHRPAVAQRLFGGHAVGRMLRIGDGEAGDPPRVECRGKVVEVAVGFERRAVGGEDDDAPERVERAVVAGEPVPWRSSTKRSSAERYIW
jgi:hypothetical protein